MPYTIYFTGQYVEGSDVGLYAAQVNGTTVDYAWLPTPGRLAIQASSEMEMVYPGTCGYLARYQWFGTDGYGTPNSTVELKRGKAWQGFSTWTATGTTTYSNWPFRVGRTSSRYFSVDTG